MNSKLMAASISPIISLVLYRRPQYARRVLEALSACTGIEEYTVLVSVDLYQSNMSQQLIDKVHRVLSTVCSFECVAHEERLGCDANTRYCLD